MATEEKHVCPTCQVGTGGHGHMCVPVEHPDEQCEWCGALIVNQRHLCDGKVQELAYVCNSCGRSAVSGEMLCQPQKIA